MDSGMQRIEILQLPVQKSRTAASICRSAAGTDGAINDGHLAQLASVHSAGTNARPGPSAEGFDPGTRHIKSVQLTVEQATTQAGRGPAPMGFHLTIVNIHPSGHAATERCDNPRGGVVDLCFESGIAHHNIANPVVHAVALADHYSGRAPVDDLAVGYPQILDQATTGHGAGRHGSVPVTDVDPGIGQMEVFQGAAQPSEQAAMLIADHMVLAVVMTAEHQGRITIQPGTVQITGLDIKGI